MSYDIDLCDSITGEPLLLDAPHHMTGGTYPLGGSDVASFNVTYNYSEHFGRVLGEKGIRSIYGMSGADSILVLGKAIADLGDDVSDDYWEPTEGNAKRALMCLLALAKMRPDGVWNGD